MISAPRKERKRRKGKNLPDIYQHSWEDGTTEELILTTNFADLTDGEGSALNPPLHRSQEGTGRTDFSLRNDLCKGFTVKPRHWRGSAQQVHRLVDASLSNLNQLLSNLRPGSAAPRIV